MPSAVPDDGNSDHAMLRRVQILSEVTHMYRRILHIRIEALHSVALFAQSNGGDMDDSVRLKLISHAGHLHQNFEDSCETAEALIMSGAADSEKALADAAAVMVNIEKYLKRRFLREMRMKEEGVNAVNMNANGAADAKPEEVPNATGFMAYLDQYVKFMVDDELRLKRLEALVPNSMEACVEPTGKDEVCACCSTAEAGVEAAPVESEIEQRLQKIRTELQSSEAVEAVEACVEAAPAAERYLGESTTQAADAVVVDGSAKVGLDLEEGKRWVLKAKADFALKDKLRQIAGN
jgi:hypothetical protein